MDKANSSVVVDLPLKDIIKSPDNPRKHIDAKQLQDLAGSILQNGVLQPITVRKGADNGSFDLIIGERRVRASEIAAKDTIPAIIIEATDEEVERMQFIENMDRADVHPMDEAAKYAVMLDRENSPYDLKAIAGMVRKKESYILQRLELMKLIKPLQDDFWKDKFSLDMAIQLARLQPKDQKSLMGEMKDNNGFYGSIRQLKDRIERYVILDLTKAPFDIKDKDLYPKAGSCMACPKRSGANLLFEDVKNKFTCMDKECYAVKLGNHIIAQMDNVIATHPEIIFLKTSYNDPLPAVAKKIEKEGLTVIDQYGSGLSSYKQAGAEAQKVMFLSGNDAGTITTHYKTGTKKKGTKADVKELKAKGAKTEVLLEAVKDSIAGLKERSARAVELDDEKIWTEIRKNVIDVSDKMVHGKPFEPIELGALAWAMRKEVPHYMQQIDTLLGIEHMTYSTNAEEMKKTLIHFSSFTDEQVNEVCRIFMIKVLNEPNNSHNTSTSQGLLKAVTELYHPMEIKAIQDAQDEVAAKRIERANERLEKMRKEEKDLQSKVKMNGGKKSAGKQLIDMAKEEEKAAKKKPAGKKKTKQEEKDAEDTEIINLVVGSDDDEEYLEDQGADLDKYSHEEKGEYDEDYDQDSDVDPDNDDEEDGPIKK